jgi:serine/threonine protein kinase
MTLQAGEIIGQYEIVGQIGSGGMATVYKAYHEKLDRHVAIKLMHDTFVQDDNFIARFQREARIVARLEHPHIVPVYDYAESSDRPYLVMKYIDGGTLKRRLIKRGITLDEIKTMMTSLADSLTYAHEKDVLHRDIKPSNILIDDRDLPYITDFGLARIAQVGESTISHDMMLGTPFYISPEQAKGDKDLAPTTDIYSFGIILYELLVGTVPFTADTPYAIVHEHIYNKPTPPSHINKDLTPAIDAVIMKALAKNPIERYQTTTELMTAFNTAMDASGVTQLPPDRSVVQKTPKPKAQIPVLPSEPNIDGEQSIPSPQMNYTYDKQGRRVKVEGAWDMGNFSFNDIGKKLDKGIRSSVDYISGIAEQIEGKTKAPQPTQEEIIRERIEKKLHARREMIQHLFVYVMVNSMLWLLYLSSIDAMSIFSGTPIATIDFGFPWPIFPTGFWGIGVVMQYVEYHYKHGSGAEKREEEIEQEISRQMRLSQIREKERNKGHYSSDEADYEIFDLDQIEARQVRLNDEGELTDSFIQEADNGQRHQGRR